MTTAFQHIQLKQELYEVASTSANNSQAPAEEHEICDVKILGRIDTEFRFEGIKQCFDIPKNETIIFALFFSAVRFPVFASFARPRKSLG